MLINNSNSISPSSSEEPNALDFLNAEPQNIHEGLFSVEPDGLEPITSPFLMSGIYKRVGARVPQAATAGTSNRGNVFVTNGESSGRLVPINMFNDLYDIVEESTEEPQQIPKVVPKQSSVPVPQAEHVDVLSMKAFDMLKTAHRDRIVIDRTRNEITRNRFGSNKTIIYRFCPLAKLSLKMPSMKRNNALAQSTKQKLAKLGRPRKRTATEGGHQVATKKAAISVQSDSEQYPTAAADVIIKYAMPPLRTRSGRVVQTLTLAVNQQTDDAAIGPITPKSEVIQKLLSDLKDRDYVGSTADQEPLAPNKACDEHSEGPTQPLATSSPTKRRIPPEAICPTCHKIFLGRRLQRHYISYPEHMIVPPAQVAHSNASNSQDSANAGEELTLFRFLTSKLQKSHLNEDQRAELFLNEINDLVEQLQLRSSQLVRSTSGLHMVNAPTARVLGIPEGQYALDMSAIEEPPELEPPSCLINFANTLPAPGGGNTRSLDYTTLSVSIDNTLTDEAVQKLNLSAGGKLLPPSEESLLRAVDDFVVRDGMEKLGETNLLHPPVGASTDAAVMPHYDHASDNAVEAVSMKETPTAQQAPPLLDLDVDFFQFRQH